MSKIYLKKNFIIKTCKQALKEDLYPSGDITSKLLEKEKIKKLKIVSNQKGVIAGLDFVKETFKIVDRKIKLVLKKKDGSVVKKGSVIAVLEGRLAKILSGERVALNFLSHMSGIATLTKEYSKKVGKNCKICCTRKTIPNLRMIQKYSVKVGGGINHRFNLSDEYLIKDNHISKNKDFVQIIKKAIRLKKNKIITVEVDRINQLKKIVGLSFHRILLDNMNIKNLRLGVKISKKYYETEASGGVNLKNIKKISSTGVDRISVGAITHSSDALDIKLEI